MNVQSILICLFFSVFASAQNHWSVLNTVEETVLYGDTPSSFNFADISNLAANSGMRMGIHRMFNDEWAIEATLGVIGTSRKGSYSTKLIPVEIISHYNLIPIISKLVNIGDIKISKFNIDFGIGSSLINAVDNNDNGSFSLSENINLGLSSDLFTFKSGVLSIGYRHTFYLDDNIDAEISGNSNDALGRFYTSFRWNLTSKLNQPEYNAMSLKLSGLQSELTKIKMSNEELVLINTGLQDSIDSIRVRSVSSDSNVVVSPLIEDVIQSNKQKQVTVITSETKLNSEDSSNIEGSSVFKNGTPDTKSSSDNVNSGVHYPVALTGSTALKSDLSDEILFISTTADKNQLYAIVVGSYSTYKKAKSMLNWIGPDAKIIYNPELSRYRVAFKLFSSYKSAKFEFEKVKFEFESCWIIKI